MNMPGFNAEASVYRTGRHYQIDRQVINSSTKFINQIYPSMISTGGVDCSNCVGGECVELHCFENWTHGGGGSGGPYEGGGGGGGRGTRRGCVDDDGKIRRHGTTVITTVVGPGGGTENTYVVRQRCNNGRWNDVPY